MPMPTSIKEGLARSPALATPVSLATMKRVGFSVPKEGAGESTGRRRKQLDRHCRTSPWGHAPGMPCQPHGLPCAPLRGHPHPSGLPAGWQAAALTPVQGSPGWDRSWGQSLFCEVRRPSPNCCRGDASPKLAVSPIPSSPQRVPSVSFSTKLSIPCFHLGGAEDAQMTFFPPSGFH